MIKGKIEAEITWYKDELSNLESLKLPDGFNLKMIVHMYDDLLSKIQASFNNVKILIETWLSTPKELIIRAVEEKYNDLLHKVQATKEIVCASSK